MKPCPFCNTQEVSISPIANNKGDIVEYAVECEKCAACGPPFPTKEEAEWFWDTRVGD